MRNGDQDPNEERRHLDYAGAGEDKTVMMPLGILSTLKVTARQTGGAYSLFELEVEPGGRECPHIQHREDECLYVVEGHFEFAGEDSLILAARGATVYVPKGTLHSFENVGEAAGKLLAVYTPGGSHEDFVEEAGSPAHNALSPLPVQTGADPDRLRLLAATHGIEIPASSP